MAAISPPNARNQPTELTISSVEPLIAGVELGGTKGVALIARGATILDRVRVPTTTPAATLTALSDSVATWQEAHGPIAALGIGSFGPLGLDRARTDYGHITTTPKPGWADVDVVGHFAPRFPVPIAFDTDVSGAALAEARWGAAQGAKVVVYLTVGTGIGGGVVVAGKPVHGRVHPELGHIRPRRLASSGFAGVCPYHGDCLEGLCSGPAIAARTGRPATDLAPDHPVWAEVAAELAELMTVLILTLSADRILLGGGVGHGQHQLLPMIRTRTAELLAGYVAGLDEAALDEIIRHPGLGDDAGPLGAIALGLDALANSVG